MTTNDDELAHRMRMMRDFGFVDYDRRNYRLRPGSRFRSAATDGTDPGADIDKLPKLPSTND